MSAIKICGFTRAADAIAAAEYGADFLGLNFFERSPRFITAEAARALVAEVHAQHRCTRFVGIFVDEDPGRILRIAETVNLCGAQLHGAEGRKAVERLKRAGLFVIKAHRIGSAADLAKVGGHRADAALLDAHVEGALGGTGTRFDWSLTGNASSNASLGPVFLAGGLTPDNVTEAIQTVRPWGVDVSSGVESAPGIKDGESMQRFITAARITFREQGDRDEQRP